MAEDDEADDRGASGEPGDPMAAPEEVDLSPDELVGGVQRRKRAFAGREPQDLSLLSGFLGESDVPGHARLFTDPTLKCWFDIPTDAIHFRRRNPAEQDQFGGRSNVWFDSDARVVRGEVTIGGVEADFLTGQYSAATPLLPDDDGVECGTKRPKFNQFAFSPEPTGKGCCAHK